MAFKPDKPASEVLATFVRRRYDAYSVLVEWLPTSHDAAAILGRDLYTAALETPWDDDHAILKLRRQIWERLEPGERACLCREWRDRQIMPLGSTTVDLLNEDFETLKDRNPWLHLVRCRTCGQHWYAAVDTVEDDYYLRRLNDSELGSITALDTWPADFDEFRNVWPILPGEPYVFVPPWPLWE